MSGLCGVLEFDNLDEIVAWQADQDRLARTTAALLPQLPDGGCYVRPLFEDELTVWGQIQPLPLIKSVRERHEEQVERADRGYYMTWSASACCDGGELGSVHVSHMIAISRETFLAAVLLGLLEGWPVLDQRWFELQAGRLAMKEEQFHRHVERLWQVLSAERNVVFTPEELEQLERYGFRQEDTQTLWRSLPLRQDCGPWYSERLLRCG